MLRFCLWLRGLRCCLPFSVLGCTTSLFFLSSLMGFWPTINALAGRVVDGFFIWGVLPVVFWLTGLTHKDSGGWGYKGTSYPPDSSFIGFLRYFMEVAAPPACSTSPSAAVASWSATTYLPKPYSQLTYISIGCSTTRHPWTRSVWNGCPKNSYHTD